MTLRDRLSFVRSLLFTDPLIILCTIVMGSISVAFSVFDSAGRAQDRVMRIWARMLVWIAGIRLEIEGIEKLDPTASYVFVSNHLSLFDTPVMLCAIPRRFLFVANAKYFKIPFLGTHLTRSGHLAVETTDVRASLKSMTEAARHIEERQFSVLLFPEGSRSKDGLMHEFKEGAAYIAIKSRVPVMPMAIRGTREVLEVGSIHIRGRLVRVRFGEPIATKDLDLKARGELNARMRDRVAELREAIGGR